MGKAKDLLNLTEQKKKIKVQALDDVEYKFGKVKKGQTFDGYILKGEYWVELPRETVDFDPKEKVFKVV